MNKTEASQLYMWFKLYQIDINSDCAKWDFLNVLRRIIKLESRHEEFYQQYAKKHILNHG